MNQEMLINQMSELIKANNKLRDFKHINENSGNLVISQPSPFLNPTMNNKIYNNAQKNMKKNQPHHNSSNSSLRKLYKEASISPNTHQLKKNNINQSLKNLKNNAHGYESGLENKMLLSSFNKQKQLMSSSQGISIQNPSIDIIKKRLSQNIFLQNMQPAKFLRSANGNFQNIQKHYDYPSDLKEHEKTKQYKINQKRQDKNDDISSKKSKSTGKLILGKQFKPTLILSRDQRLNPFYQPKNSISQEIINKKGILQLLSMGVLSKKSDFGQILNNKFELIPQNAENKKAGQGNPNSQQIQQMLDTFFPTNPLTNSGIKNIESRQDEKDIIQQQMGQVDQQQKNKHGGRKSRTKKVKKLKVEQVKFQMPQPKYTLAISNYNIDQNESYKEYIRKMRLQGNQTHFKALLQRLKQFCQKYKCKRIYFNPQKIDYISGLRKLTDRALLECIENYKVLGLGVLIKGTKEQIKQSYAKTFFARYRFKKSMSHLQKIQQLKRYFRIRKYYVQMTLKRENFVKMKLSSFAQSQRRFIESYRQSIASNVQSEQHVNGKNFPEEKKTFSPQVQIHLLSNNFSPQESKTHYKFRERLRAQLTRLYNSDPEDIILLVDDQNQVNQQAQNIDQKVQKQISYNFHTTKTIKQLKQENKSIEDILNENQQKFVPQKLPFYQSLLQELGQIPAKIHIIKLGLSQTRIKLMKKNSKTQKQSKIKTLAKQGSNQQKGKNYQYVTNTYQIQQTASIYYGLNRQIINQIKSICRKRTVAIVPYMSSINIAKISQYFGINAFAGSLMPQSILKLDQDVQNNQENENEETLKTISKKLNSKRKIIQSFQMANHFYQSKINVKKMFRKLGIPTPDFIDVNQRTIDGKPKYHDQISFIQDFTKEVFRKRQVSRWVLKLPNSRMSRGIAFFETESIKIIKEKKKKNSLSASQIQQIKVILKSILNEKIEIPHTSLLDRKQFFEKFFENIQKPHLKNTEKSNQIQKMGGYIQEVIEATNHPNSLISNNSINSCAVFGKIDLDGRFIFMGSYRKISTEQGVNCSAFYPAEQLTKPISISGQIPLRKILLDINKISKYLYEEQNVFGYITFEVLFNCRTNQYYFIDLEPNLNEYSSLYFFYQNQFKMENKQASFQTKILIKEEQKQSEKEDITIDQVIIRANQLPKSILYCPFLDNNGNKMESYLEFQQQLLNKKGISTRFDFDGIRDKSVTNLQSRVQLQSKSNLENKSNVKSSKAKFKKQNRKGLANQQQGYHFFYLTANKPDVLGVACFANQQRSGVKMFLEVLTFLIENGGKFNKFDKRYGENMRKKIMAQQNQAQLNNRASRNLPNTSINNMKLDGTYIMDILWKFREMKKRQKSQQQKKTIILMSEAKKQQSKFKQAGKPKLMI